MNKKEFKQKLKNIGFNQKKFATLTGCGYSTVKGWESTPKWVELVINYIEVMYKINDIDEAAKSISSLKDKVQLPDF